MKISDLISKLTEVQNEHGNIEVYYYPYGWVKSTTLEKVVVSVDSTGSQTLLIIGDD